MHTKLALSIFAAVAIMALFGATVTYALPTAEAQEGVPFEKNFGQCQKDKNRNACENNK